MIRPFGEASLIVGLRSAAEAIALARSLREAPITGVAATVPALRSVLVELASPGQAERSRVSAALARRISRLVPAADEGRLRRIPVVYGGDHGPDLDEAAARCSLSPGALVDRHAAAELRVLFCGFAPGFAYLGDLPSQIQVPRLETPRTRTPAGSVAIAGAMTGIYPADLPGGWRVIGRTPRTLFDPRRDPPAYLVPGDRVRFEPVAGERWASVDPIADDW